MSKTEMNYKDEVFVPISEDKKKPPLFNGSSEYSVTIDKDLFDYKATYVDDGSFKGTVINPVLLDFYNKTKIAVYSEDDDVALLLFAQNAISGGSGIGFLAEGRAVCPLTNKIIQPHNYYLNTHTVGYVEHYINTNLNESKAWHADVDLNQLKKTSLPITEQLYVFHDFGYFTINITIK